MLVTSIFFFHLNALTYMVLVKHSRRGVDFFFSFLKFLFRATERSVITKCVRIFSYRQSIVYLVFPRRILSGSLSYIVLFSPRRQVSPLSVYFRQSHCDVTASPGHTIGLKRYQSIAHNTVHEKGSYE